MITDERWHVIELAARRLFKARNPQLPFATTAPRFKVPRINLDAPIYIDLIVWQVEITEPPIMKHFWDQQIDSFVEAGGEGELFFLRLTCHTEAVERAVKITEAYSSVCTPNARKGLIKTKLESSKVMPKFETKRDFRSN